MKSPLPPAPTASVSAVDPIVAALKDVIASALHVAQMIDRRTEAVRSRPASALERRQLQTWSNDADCAYHLVAELQKAERYLNSVRIEPEAS
jgi:hypothetical protein